MKPHKFIFFKLLTKIYYNYCTNKYRAKLL